MSGRYKDNKGSSRSARDDSRLHTERERSRSPQRRRTPPSRSRYSTSPSPPRHSKSGSRERDQRSYRHGRDKRDRRNSSEEEVPAPPPPPRISKISIDFSKPKAPIKMNLTGPVKSVPKKPTIASVFGADDDDDEEPEEMPAEAKMRMRNIGRETPTSAGPNSFGKTKQGFCDAKKVFEKNLKHALETVEGRKGMPKFPQTIYKINANAQQ